MMFFKHFFYIINKIIIFYLHQNITDKLDWMLVITLKSHINMRYMNKFLQKIQIQNSTENNESCKDRNNNN